MTTIATSGGFYIPNPINDSFNASFGNILLDSANEAAGVVFKIPKTGIIDRVGFRCSTISTGAILDLRLETVDVNGNPSGTLVQSSSNILKSVADTDDNTYFTVHLGSGTLVNQGDLVSFIVRMSATSAGSLSITTQSFVPVGGTFPYPNSFLGGAWTKGGGAGALTFSMEYDDGSSSFIDYCAPIFGLSSLTVTTASTPDEVGLAFAFPFPSVLRGMWVHFSPTSDTNVNLYDADGSTVLNTFLIGSNNRPFSTNQGTQIHILSSAYDLVAANTYRIALVPNQRTIVVPCAITSSNLTSQGLEGYPNVIGTSRTNSGAWTDDPRQRALMGLVFSGFDNATGGSGGGTTTILGAGAWGF